MKRFLTILFCISFIAPLYAQNNSGLGMGLTVQYGVNSRADYMVWDVETQGIPKYPDKRLFVGPVFQFKNFQKIQAEVGLLYGRTVYQSPDFAVTNNQQVTVNEIQIPLQFVLNTRSPIKYHSALVYHGGFMINYLNVPQQGSILQDYNFISPSLVAGIRLATELRSFGRFEYGVSYVKSIRDHHSFMFQNDDVVLPSVASIRHQTGQIRINVIYYFSPRVYSWSKNRYKLTSLD